MAVVSRPAADLRRAAGTAPPAWGRYWLLSAAFLGSLVACTTAPVQQSYRCEGGATLVAAYPDTDTATLRYQGRTHHLRIARSASGARYVGDGLEWWTKGTGAGAEGALFRHMADGTSGEIIEQCTAS